MSCHDRDRSRLSQSKASKSAEDELRFQAEAFCPLGALANWMASSAHDWTASGTGNLRVVLRGHDEDVRRVALEQVALQRRGWDREPYSEGHGACVAARTTEERKTWAVRWVWGAAAYNMPTAQTCLLNGRR